MINSIPHQLHKRSTQFKECKNSPPLINVKLSPDPIVSGKTDTITISGKLKLPITKFSNFFVAFSDPDTGELIDSLSVPICDTDGIKCPVDEGTEFTAKSDFSIPADLPKRFGLEVIVTSPPNHVIGCALAPAPPATP